MGGEERKEVVAREGDIAVQDFTGDGPGSMWVAGAERRGSLEMGVG